MTPKELRDLHKSLTSSPEEVADKVLKEMPELINKARNTISKGNFNSKSKFSSKLYEKVIGGELASGGWIQKAVSSIKKRGTEGVCTGSKFGGPSCPKGSKRYNLAKVFKSMHKKELGDTLTKVGIAGAEMMIPGLSPILGTLSSLSNTASTTTPNAAEDLYTSIKPNMNPFQAEMGGSLGFHKYSGPSHENGGIPVSAKTGYYDGNNPDAEVEGDETVVDINDGLNKTKYVFSKKLII